jgi:hypothetical protein
MAAVSAIGFVAPALDPHNAGANAAGGEGNDISNVAMFKICVAVAAENKGEDLGGSLLLEPHVTDAVESKGGVTGDRAPQKRARLDVY